MNNDTQTPNQFVQNKAAEISCHHRPGFHIAAPAGWINDPNGLCFHNGIYHAFYQHHPYSSDWGPMHWGHVTSKDMVRWEHQLSPLRREKKAPVSLVQRFQWAILSHCFTPAILGLARKAMMTT
ncbi:sucrose-6-phosphate hydrolase [Vibrio sp. JCM 19236]|nr:sucrose-6-phosphate hydrolase [Vibrio sp. JCM 19236]